MDLRALWWLARPALLPFVLLLPILGFGWAHWNRALPLADGELVALLLVLAAWTALHAGALWLNAQFDQDTGEVLLGQTVPVPGSAPLAGYAALVLSSILAFAASAVVGLAALCCAALAVLYSHPGTGWKAHPLGGPLVNLLGYGLLSPLAGWVIVPGPPDTRSALVWLLVGFGTLGCYFAAQAFQEAEDQARGYRTLVATHGPRSTLRAARLCLGAAFLGGAALGILGWLPRLCLVAAPVAWWVDAWLRHWANTGGGEAQARGLALRLLLGAALLILLAYIDYAIDYLAERPVCGQATARGHAEPRTQ